MVTAGVDIGHRTVKVVLLNRGGVVSQQVAPLTEASSAAEEVLEAALRAAGLGRGDLDAVVSTGVGRGDFPLAHRRLTEITCDAKGTTWLCPAARTVLDIGAEEYRAIRCDASGRVMDFAMNDKCAAGAGIFLEVMAKALEVDLAEMGPLSLRWRKEVVVNSTCAVFAESEVISLVHSGMDRVDILHGIHDSLASRLSSLLLRIGVEPAVVLVGGVAHNVGVIDALRRRLGMDILVPEGPDFAGALGAALLGQEG